MSSQPPFPNDPNPYARDNPYQAGQPATNQPQGPSNSLLAVPAIILLVLGAISLVLGLFQLVGVMANGVQVPPNQDPAQVAGFKFGFWFSTIMIPVLNSVVVAGSIAMLTKKMHGLAMAGAICGVIPICGPCLILGIPFGIWAMILLLKPEVKAAFT